MQQISKRMNLKRKKTDNNFKHTKIKERRKKKRNKLSFTQMYQLSMLLCCFFLYLPTTLHDFLLVYIFCFLKYVIAICWPLVYFRLLFIFFFNLASSLAQTLQLQNHVCVSCCLFHFNDFVLK